MMRRLAWFSGLAVGILFTWGDVAQAQPGRQMPGSRQPIGTSPPRSFPAPNERVRPNASQTGFQSADIYAKPGYPKYLGDAVETGSSQGGTAGAGGGAISGGAAGVGGIAGGGTLGIAGGGGGGGGSAGFFRPSRGDGFAGFTGGGFSGVVPKGFGFGGMPDLTHSALNPLHGAVKP